MSKSQEQRIEDAAKVLAQALGCHWNRLAPSMRTSFLNRAHQVLEAADAEPPKPVWPTDESLEAYGEAIRPRYPVTAEKHREHREWLRVAMLADPIIQAAIAYRNRVEEIPGRNKQSRRLTDAVNEAGL